MRVNVFVEGPSDKFAMEALLRPIIERKRQSGIDIEFFGRGAGDRKLHVVQTVPMEAVNILRNDATSLVVALPDLSPKNKGCKHETAEQLYAGMQAIFARTLANKHIVDERIKDRFYVFCFKHDLEALVLACEDALRIRLETDIFRVQWHKPVEDQNHDRYPKRVVEDLFSAHRHRYKDTVDAPVILGVSDISTVTEACSQCFKPFVDFLIAL